MVVLFRIYAASAVSCLFYYTSSYCQEGGAGSRHNCVLDQSGQAKCWGLNQAGELGWGRTDGRGDGNLDLLGDMAPIDVGRERNIVRASLGPTHTCGVLDDGTVKCFGDGRLGKLGQGDVAPRGGGPGEMGDNLLPVELGTQNQIKTIRIAAGRDHSCALLETNQLYCWGDSSLGQLGLGDTAVRGDGPGEMGAALPAIDLGSGLVAAEIVSGDSYNCVLFTNGSVKCFGDSAFGQLGLNTTLPVGDEPGEMGDALPFVALGTNRVVISLIANGYFHTCAVFDSGGAKCFGRNHRGQLGVGDTHNRGDGASSSSAMGDDLPEINFGPDSKVEVIVVGAAHTCSLLDTKKLYCFGDNEFGQLGVGSKASFFAPAPDAVNIGDGLIPISLFAGAYHSCVVLLGANAAMKCWGGNSHGQLGVSDTLTRGDEPNEMGSFLPLVVLSLFANATLVIGWGGGLRSCALLSDALSSNLFKCWGENVFGQLGYGDVVSRGDGPSLMGTDLPYVDIGSDRIILFLSAGDGVTCVGLNAGELKCFGKNDFGQLGQGDTSAHGDSPATTGSNLPAIRLGSARTVVGVVCGASHTCALLDDGGIKCFGRNDRGQLGTGSSRESVGSTPTDMGDALSYVMMGSGVVAVLMTAGVAHSCAILSDRGLKCWGANADGQLGLGDTRDRGRDAADMADALPYVDVGENLSRDIDTVVAGARHTCVRAHGTAPAGSPALGPVVKCFGANEKGQLGLGDTASRGTTVDQMGDMLPMVDFGPDRTVAAALAAGGEHNCALLSDGAVVCWGANAAGQCGRGDTAAVGSSAGQMGAGLVPVDLGSGRAALSLFLGADHSCALLSTGEVKCWGANTAGQLGLGDVANRGDAPGEMGAALPAVSLFAACASCPRGQAKLPAASACVRCDAAAAAGYAPVASSAGCAACALGKYGASAAAAECSLCAPHYYGKSVAATSAAAGCAFCPFATCAGSSRCSPCAQGTYLSCPTTGKGGNGECTPCPAGRFGSAAGASGASACKECAVGTYQSLTGQRTCDSCPAGTHGFIPGAISIAQCTACSPGSFSPVSGATACESCVAGKYSDTAGRSDCSDCPAGSFSNATGAVSPVVCGLCGPQQSSVAGGSELDACFCLTGFYLLAPGLCAPCPAGSRCDQTGLSLASLPILPGFWRASNSSRLIRECAFPSLCAGSAGAAAAAAGDGLCTTESEGPLCAVCRRGTYFDGVALDCVSCDSSDARVAAVSVALALLSCFAIAGIWMFISHAFSQIEKENGSSAAAAPAPVVPASEPGAAAAFATAAAAAAASTVSLERLMEMRGLAEDLRSSVAEQLVSTNSEAEPEANEWQITRKVKEDRSAAPRPVAAFASAFGESSDGGARRSSLSSRHSGEQDQEPLRGNLSRSINSARGIASRGREEGARVAVKNVLRDLAEVKKFVRPGGLERLSSGGLERLSVLRRLQSSLGFGEDGNPTALKKMIKFKSVVFLHVSLFQIISALPDTLAFKYPAAFQSFSSGASFFGLDFVHYLPVTCAGGGGFNFFGELVVATVFPFVILAALVVLYVVLVVLRASTPAKRAKLGSTFFQLFLLLAFLVYTSVSAKIVQALVCDADFDGDNGSSSYLRADYSIDCESEYYSKMRIYAIAMFFVYPVGIPLMYFVLLFRVRGRINPIPSSPQLSLEKRDADDHIKAYGILFNSFKPGLWWWESFECMRRFTLTGLLVFVNQGSTSQIFVGCAVALVSIKMYSHFMPYRDADLNKFAEIIQWQVFLTIFAALYLDSLDIGRNSFRAELISICLIMINLGSLITVLTKLLVTFMQDLKVLATLAKVLRQERFRRATEMVCAADWERQEEWVRSAVYPSARLP